MSTGPSVEQHPLVSVIIPCHDVGDYIAASLRSALAQTHPHVEIIVVNDRSSDHTQSEVERVQQQEPGRIQLVQATGKGAGAARNTGLRRSRGAWIQFLDADDRLLPDKIAGQMALVRSQDVAIVVGDYLKEFPDGTTELETALYDTPWMGLVSTRLGTTSANLWERGALEQVGGWDERLASSQDYDLAFRLLKHGARVAYASSARTVVHKRPTGSISRTDTNNNWVRYIELRADIRQHLAALDPVAHEAEIRTADAFMYMGMHQLAMSDVHAAADMYRRYLPAGYVPASYSRPHRMAQRVLGFTGGMCLMRALRAFRSTS